MAIDLGDEILQDFLVEAGEILERLGEQLVDLEQRPKDVELLNAVFRGFHTVKGGAGFLNLTPLVEVCHRAEDVFNTLRQGERQVDAKLMDVILRVLDVVNGMTSQVRAGEEPVHADPILLGQLEVFAKPSGPGEDSVQTAPSTRAADKTEQKIESMPETVAVAIPAAAQSDRADITDEEFESLLDQIHGAGATKQTAVAASAVASSTPNDEITDSEFENLLDELHGKPQVQTSKQGQSKQTAAAKPADPVPVSPLVAKKPVVAEKPTIAADSEKDEGAAKTATSKDAAQAETSVRVDTKRLDDIMNLVGELVLVRNRLGTLKATMDEHVAKAVANLDLVTADLQNAVMKTRMQPIKKVFGRFPRVVRDLARTLNKQVNLVMQGEETDLDKNLVEALADPLVHLVRNAVDHGIEMPDVRKSQGKPAEGTIILSAEQEGDHILLSIQDDGAGMDADLLRHKAVEKGLMDEDAAARLDEKACYNLIFFPGFSTKNEISDISGRGVGMDVVKTRITQLNGTVDITSKYGKGSLIEIKVPLTLAIMPTLMVQLSNQIFALPLANVIEIFDRSSARTSTVDGRKVVIVRDKALPLVNLRDWLVRGSSDSDEASSGGYVVVVSFGSQNVGCIVDHLIGQEEVVIKPLGSILHGTKGLAGATITGNGRIALILDMPSLMGSYARR